MNRVQPFLSHNRLFNCYLSGSPRRGVRFAALGASVWGGADVIAAAGAQAGLAAVEPRLPVMRRKPQDQQRQKREAKQERNEYREGVVDVRDGNDEQREAERNEKDEKSLMAAGHSLILSGTADPTTSSLQRESSRARESPGIAIPEL